MEFLVNQEPKEIVLEYKGQEYKFKLKELSWAVRNRLISKCIRYEQNNVSIDLDQYYRRALKEMIVEAPWPIIQTDEMLAKLEASFGYTLQQFVPNPFGESETKEEELPKN